MSFSSGRRSLSGGSDGTRNRKVIKGTVKTIERISSRPSERRVGINVDENKGHREAFLKSDTGAAIYVPSRYASDMKVGKTYEFKVEEPLYRGGGGGGRRFGTIETHKTLLRPVASTGSKFGGNGGYQTDQQDAAQANS